MDDTKATERRAWLSAERGAIVLLLALAVCLAGVWWARRGGWRDQPAIATSQPDGSLKYLNKIDPNTDSWQTLDCAPGIGEKRAKAIVAYRNASPHQPAFTQPDDLRHAKAHGVPGIGQKTLEELEPFLVFPSTQDD